MSVRLVLLLVAALVTLTSTANGQAQSGRSAPAEPTLVFAHVNVVDVIAGRVRSDVTVVVEGARIAAVTRSPRATAPAGATIVDARGKYLVPGLCDMHAHVFSRDRRDVWLPLYVANGVTCIRDMAESMPLEEVRRWREQIDRGDLAGPRVLAIAGKLLDGASSPWPPELAWRLHSPDDARAVVRAAKRDGADFVKVYDSLSDDLLAAVLAEAKTLRLPVAGHLPNTADAGWASDSGLRSIEHLRQMLRSVSRRDQDLRVADFPGPIAALSRKFISVELEAARSIDSARASALFARFKRNGTWQVPTLVLERKWRFFASGEVANAPALDYMKHSVIDAWKAQPQRAGLTADDYRNGEEVFRAKLALVGRMHRAGVGILAGTDANSLAAPVVPGFSLHDELTLLVHAGLTPMAALQAATIQPARFMGVTADAGSIEVEKRADLVLLDADPTRAIANTQKISAVVLNGRYFDRAALDAMLSRVREVVAENR